MNASIVVVGFALGCTMHFKQIFVGGASGILLGVIVTLIGGLVTIGADKLTGVVTAILTPILTAWVAKQNKKKLATVSQVND